MKIFGHPLHLMLIHFPAALFPMSVVCSALNVYMHEMQLVYTAFFMQCAGVIVGWLAVITGTFDLLAVSRDNRLALPKAWMHGAINTGVTIVFTVIAWLQFKHYPVLTEGSVTLLLSRVGAVLIMIAGNYLGSNLILKYKIAVLK